MMTSLSVQNPEAKSKQKTLVLQKSKRKLKTTRTKNCPNPFGSLRGFLSKKTLTHNNLSKRVSSTKWIKISTTHVKNPMPQHYKRLTSKSTKVKNHQNSLYFIFHCAKVLWRKKRNVTIFWQSFTRNVSPTNSLSRTLQNTWAIQNWSWKSMTACTLGSLVLRYWHVD